MSCETTTERVCSSFLWWTWGCHETKVRCCTGNISKSWFVFGIGAVKITVQNSTTKESWWEVAFGFIVATERGFGTICRGV